MDRTNDPANEAAVRSVRLNALRFDLESNELFDENGDAVRMRPQCLAVLRALALKPGLVVSKEELVRTVWPNVVVTDDSLVQCISDLRRALQDAQHRLLQTEPRRGYRLTPSETLREEAREPPLNRAHDSSPAQEIRLVVTGDGMRIAYAVCGDGIPVVLAPCWISHLDFDFDCPMRGPLLRAVSGRHRLVRFDQRGQGMSDRHVLAGTIDEAVADMKAVVDAAEVHRFVLWSVGAGTASAVRFAALYPERVERLIVSGGWARGVRKRRDPRWPLSRGASTLNLIEEHWGDENPHVRMLLLARQYPSATGEEWRSYADLMRKSWSPAGALSATIFNIDYDVTEDLGRVQCPTMVTHSRHDQITPFDEVRLIVSGIANSRLVTLDSDNVVPLPHEPAFAQLIDSLEEFIESGWPAHNAVGPSHRARADRRPSLKLVESPGGRASPGDR